MPGGWKSAEPLLVCYAPLGDPECSADVLEIYAEQGVDIVEVGVPTDDPYLDGATVADSMRRVLRTPNPMARIHSLIDAHGDAIVNRCRLVLMGYRDMPFAFFTDLARRRLIQGLLLVHGSAEHEPAALQDWLETESVERIGFVDSNLSSGMIERAREAGGYVMLQAHDGPTGVRERLNAHNGEKMGQLRRAGIKLPIVLGFGIGSPQQAAAAIRLGADGVVVGSACIDVARDSSASLRCFIASVRKAINEASLSAASG